MLGSTLGSFARAVMDKMEYMRTFKRLWVWDNGDYGWFEKGIEPMDKNGRWVEDDIAERDEE